MFTCTSPPSCLSRPVLCLQCVCLWRPELVCLSCLVVYYRLIFCFCLCSADVSLPLLLTPWGVFFCSWTIRFIISSVFSQSVSISAFGLFLSVSVYVLSLSQSTSDVFKVAHSNDPFELFTHIGYISWVEVIFNIICGASVLTAWNFLIVFIILTCYWILYWYAWVTLCLPGSYGARWISALHFNFDSQTIQNSDRFLSKENL